MQQFQRFLEQNFIWLFLICFAWVFVAFGWRYHRRKQNGIVFPEVAPERIQFHERAASGRSHKNVFTRFGGARNCLQVTVTDTEIWIRPLFPFSILARDFDLEHRISRAAITSIQSGRSAFARSLLLDYRDERGQCHRLSLLLRKPDDFLNTLGIQTKGI